MKNDTEIEGYKNRHTSPIPNRECYISALIPYHDENKLVECKWIPFDKSKYNKNTMPPEGYQGTAKVISGLMVSSEYHVWQQNNRDFIYYNIIEK